MSQNYTPFGYEGALYRNAPLGNHSTNLLSKSKSEKLIKLIEKYNHQAKFTVESIKRRYNSTINDILKDVTGLKYKHKGSAKYNRVTIDIVTSIPPELQKILENCDVVLIELILLYDSLISATDFTKFAMVNYSAIIANFPNLERFAKNNEVLKVNLFLRILQNEIRNSDIYQKLNKLSLDNLLGAYFYNKNKIEIYWPALAFYSSWKNLPLIDLAFIILAHEKSHAITHLGYDLDGDYWNTVDFDQCDIMIVEGIAQHYTEHVCTNVMSSISIRDTFKKLMTDQGAPYKCYLDWLPDVKDRDEKIRLTMLNARKSKIYDYKAFLDELQASSKNVKSK